MSLIPIPLPDLGEGVTEGEIVKIKVKAGESIQMDQVLVEVMTDKASMEVPSSVEGLVKEVSVKEGDIVSVGSPLFKIESPQGSSKESTTTDTQSRSPDKTEEKTSEDRPLQNKSQASNKGFSHQQTPEKSEEKPSGESPLKNQSQSSNESFSHQQTPASIPSTRKLAQELGIDLKQAFKNQAKIERKDLLAYVKNQMSGSNSEEGSRFQSLKEPSSSLSKNLSAKLSSQTETSHFKEKRRETLRGVQRLMFESMTLSKATIPHFTLGESAKVDHLIQLRLEMKNRMEKQGLKVGFLPFFIKALIPVIEEFPLFNSHYEASSKEIVFKEDFNIGFAVDSPQGLMVPVIKQVQKKSLLEIIKEVYEKAHQTREGSIAREDLKGASLTLTNLGGIGGMYGTPIIPPSEMSILGIYKIYPKVIKTKEGYAESHFMNLSITCDHRFIDGATAVRFLKSFIQKIEEPSLLLL